MATEIERKYLVVGDDWRSGARPVVIRQGYLFNGRSHVVRVRTYGKHAYLTIKGEAVGISRLEYEYEIPPADATVLLDTLCHRPLIEKTRFVIDVNGIEWVVDVFAGENEGLVVAEVELDSEDQQIVTPPWIGAEVTDDPKYLNAKLSEHPFKTWSQAERAPHRDAGGR